MDKGKTTKILSGGVRIGKDGKPHKWSKIHGHKTQKVTDDNWMDYGMPDDEPDPIKIKNESRNMNMNKKLIRLTEQDLHKIVKESVNRIINEVSLKGKSGKAYSLHGNDEESWDIVSRLRQKKSGNSNYNTMRDEKNAEEIDAKNHPNRRSLNNANRVNASLKRTSNASKDIMAANESFIRKIVKESVNRVIKE